MRFSCLAVLGLVMLSVPAAAQVPQGKPVFATYTCSTRVPCDDRSVSAEQWAELGNNCITRAFRYTNPDGFFDIFAGLNSAKCLTPKPNSINNKVGAPLVPYCCVIPYKEGTCLINCRLATN